MYNTSDKKIISETKIVTVRELSRMINEQELNPDPVSQRPPTNSSYDNTKNKNIIKCIIAGYGIGLLIVRDIENCDELEVKRIYRNNKALVIDGGHRCRAIKYFIENKFKVKVNSKDKKFRDLSETEKESFLETKINMEFKQCSSQQAIEIFRAVNSSTAVKPYEMIMANDQSILCKYVRMMTKSYDEYNNNKIHEIFQLTYSDTGPKSSYFEKLNEQSIWHTYIWIVMHKVMGGGNINAGEKTTVNLIEKEEKEGFKFSNKHSETTSRFFNDLLAYSNILNQKINTEIFGFFQVVWFELYSKNKRFKIDMETFALKFAELRAKLTGTKKNKYTDKMIKDVDGEQQNIKSLTRNYVKAFSFSKRQQYIADIIIKEMKVGDNFEDYGIIFQDNHRCATKKQRQELFDLQQGKCWQCKIKIPSINDCEVAHDLPDTKGGKLADAKVACSKCARDQGLNTFQEQAMINQMRISQENRI